MNLEVPYGITRRLPGVPYQQARERITAALKAEGFGVLTEIDVQATLKAKLGVDMAPYVILGACNPPFAHQALTLEPGIGLLLPCNVVVAQDGADTLIAAIKPQAMFSMVQDQAALAPVAAEVDARLRRAIQQA